MMEGCTTAIRRSQATFVRAVLLAAAAVPAAAETPPGLPLGQVIDSVACLHDATQTYAVYLPSRYTPRRLWPVLYAFDPRARGRLPTQLFHAAAERLGYVVVGSNNSRNGPWPPVAAALEALWRDTHARLALDDDRVYATGMSGGNHPAIVLATHVGAGVIACAGAIEPGEVTPPDARFAWISVAGNTDFNLDLNRTLVRALVERNIAARLATFEGGHSWPPEHVAERALELVHLSAMRTGRVVPEAAFIEGYAGRGERRANELLARGLASSAAEEYAALARELAGLRPVEALEAEARRLRDTPEAKKERKHEQALASRYERQIGQLFALRQRLLRPAAESWPGASTGPPSDLAGGMADVAARAELASRLGRLARDCESKDVSKSVVARRVRDGFYVETFYSAMARRDERRFDAALELLNVCARMRPESAGPVYEMARTHAAVGSRKKAVAELRRAVRLGFGEAARLEADREWNALRDDPEFRAVAGALRAPRP